MDTSLYLDIDRWARATPGLHGVPAPRAPWGGLALLLAFARVFAGPPATGRP